MLIHQFKVYSQTVSRRSRPLVSIISRVACTANTRDELHRDSEMKSRWIDRLRLHVILPFFFSSTRAYFRRRSSVRFSRAVSNESVLRDYNRSSGW